LTCFVADVLWAGAPVVGGTVAVVDEMPEAFARVALEFLRS
jgi:hypothetical protein